MTVLNVYFRSSERLTNSFPSKDGIVRAAKVRVQGDGRKQVFLRRPIQHLIPLEVRAQLPVLEPEDPCNHPPVNNAVKEQEMRCARPRRTAIAAELNYTNYLLFS